VNIESFSYFERYSERSLADLDECREMGTKVAGIYCVFAPSELIRAAGAVPVGLCGKKEAPIAEAEKVLPANLCPLIKSSYGYAASGACPFFAYSDFVVGETTCDGKKKMYEFLGRLKPLYLLNLPHTQTVPAARDFWRGELKRFAGFLSETTGVKLTDDRIREQIALYNRMRERLYNIVRLMSDPRIPLGGLEMMTVLESRGFVVDLESYIDRLGDFETELEAVLKAGALGLPLPHARVLLTGCPVGKGSEKVIRLIEELGATVVVMENCTGIKGIVTPVPEDGDPLTALADRYLDIPCSCMTPNTGRLQSISRLVEEFDIDAVVDLSWLYCHTYEVENGLIRELCETTLNLPYLHLATDYSTSDIEQLRTRIEAFLEIISV